MDKQFKVRQSLEHLKSKISRSHRASPRYPETIRHLQGPVDHLLHDAQIIGAYSHAQGLCTHAPTKSPQRVLVDVPDLTGKRLIIHWNDLVARGQNGHPRLFVHPHMGETQPCHDTHILGPETMTLGKNKGPFLKIIPRLDDVFKGRDGAGHFHGVRIHGVAVLNHDHCIRMPWKHAARGDPGSPPFFQDQRGGGSHGNFSRNLKEGREALTGPERVLGTNRIPIHGGPEKTRQVLGGDNIPAHHPTQSDFQRNPFLAHGLKSIDDAQHLVGCLDCEEGLHHLLFDLASALCAMCSRIQCPSGPLPVPIKYVIYDIRHQCKRSRPSQPRVVGHNHAGVAIRPCP